MLPGNTAVLVPPHLMSVKHINEDLYLNGGKLSLHIRCYDLHILPQIISKVMPNNGFRVSNTLKTSVSRIKDVLFTRYCPSKLSVELIDINQLCNITTTKEISCKIKDMILISNNDILPPVSNSSVSDQNSG